MTTLTAPRGARPDPTPRHAAPPAGSSWGRVRRAVTAGVFVLATVAGVGVGVQGADVSPVAPPAAPGPAAATP